MRLALVALGFLAAGGCVPEDAGPDATDRPAAAGEVLRRGLGADPQTLDPARAEDVHAFSVLADLYEGLVVTGPDGGLVPGAALRWSVSDDGLVYTFALRPDGRWSDGRPVTSMDFVAGLRRALAPATASPYGHLLEPIDGAAAYRAGDGAAEALGVTASDELTLVIRLAAPMPELPAVLALPVAYPLPPGGADRFADAAWVGNGAYVLDRWQPGHVLVLRKNRHFRDADAVAIERVEYYPVVDAAAEFNMYRTGELDITWTVPANRVAELREARPGELRIAPSLGLYYLALDLTEAPLDDLSLRQALSMAIDRERIVELLGRGEKPAYGFVPAGMDGYTPARYDWQDLVATDRREAARRAYATAGYTAERPARLRLVYDAGGVHEMLAVAVAAMWRDVLGAGVTLDKREWKYFLATRDRRDEWDVMRFAWSGDYAHPRSFLDILSSDSPQNLPRYADGGFDRLLAAAATAGEGEFALLREAEATLLADYPLVPLYFYVSKHLVAPTVRGFSANAVNRNPTRYLALAR